MATDASPTPRLGWAWFGLAVLVLFNIVSFVDRTILNLLIVPIQKDFGLSEVQVGLLQGFAYSLLYSLVGLPLGWLADKVSRRSILFSGMVLWSAFTTACGLARSFGSLFILRSGVGASEASLTPAAFSLIADLFPRRSLATAIGFFYLGANIGGAIALLGGGFLIGLFTHMGGVTLPIVGHLRPWQATLMVVGLPGLVIANLALFIREPAQRSGAQETARLSEFFRFLKRRWALVMCQFMGFPVLAMGSLAIQAWAAIYMSRRFHWQPANIGFALSIIAGPSTGLANVIAGRVADGMLKRGRLDAYYLLHIITTLVALPFIIAAFLTPNVWLFIPLLCVGLGALTSFGGPASAALQVIAAPRHRGKLTAMYLLTLSICGTGLGPLLTGVATQYLFRDKSMVGYSLLLVVITASLVGSTMLAIGRRHLRAALAEAPSTGS